MTTKNLYSIFFILSSVSIFFLLISPKKNSVATLISELQQKKLEFQTADEYFREIEEVHEKLREYSEEISKIDFALPEDPSIPSLFDFLYQASFQTGVLLEALHTPTLKEEENLKKWTTTFTIKGNYSSLKDFVSLIEKSARLIKIENITAWPEKDRVNFSLTISVFSY